MKEFNITNGFDLSQSWAFLKRWGVWIVVVAVVALVASIALSFTIQPRYQSSAVIFPSNSNRVSKAIMDYHYSLDFMDYGTEKDCEYAIQILSSRTMQEAACERFNLQEHYGIADDDPHRQYKLDECYSSNVTVKRTEFLGVKVSVLDVDPVWAADIANFIADYYDTLCHELHHSRAEGAYGVMDAVCQEVEQDLFRLEDSLHRHPDHAASYRELIADKSEELARLQTRNTQRKVDMESRVSYKFWLDKAVPADKKSYPNRLVIGLMGTVGTVVLFVLLLIPIDRRRRRAANA